MERCDHEEAPPRPLFPPISPQYSSSPKSFLSAWHGSRDNWIAIRREMQEAWTSVGSKHLQRSKLPSYQHLSKLAALGGAPGQSNDNDKRARMSIVRYDAN